MTQSTVPLSSTINQTLRFPLRPTSIKQIYMTPIKLFLDVYLATSSSAKIIERWITEGMRLTGENWSTRQKPVPVLRSPPQIPPWDRTMTSEVRGRRLTIWPIKIIWGWIFFFNLTATQIFSWPENGNQHSLVLYDRWTRSVSFASCSEHKHVTQNVKFIEKKT